MRTCAFVLILLLSCTETSKKVQSTSLVPATSTESSGTTQTQADVAFVPTADANQGTLSPTTVVAENTPTPADKRVFRFLKATHVETELSRKELVVNAGWAKLFSKEIDVLAGDVLHIRSNAQFTIDSLSHVGQQFRILVDGKELGASSVQVNVKQGSHHMPQWAVARFEAVSNSKVKVEAQGSAFSSGAPASSLQIDGTTGQKYAHLVVEQYRTYQGLEAAKADGAFGLKTSASVLKANVATCCAKAFQNESVMAVSVPYQFGDVLRLFGQVVGIKTSGFEAHVSVLTANGNAISPYSGENVADNNHFVPQHVDALVSGLPSETQNFEYRVFGNFGRGYGIYENVSYLLAMLFSPVSKLSEPMELYSSSEYKNEFADRALSLANSWQSVITTPQLDMKKGDVLKLTAQLQLTHPPAWNKTAQCQARIGSSNPVVESIAYTTKNSSPQMQLLPLRLDALVNITGDLSSSYKFEVACSSDGAGAPLVLHGGKARLFSEIYRK